MTNASTNLIVVDSNILIYAVDRDENERGKIANSVIQSFDRTELGITNSQILIEFYSNTTRPRPGRPPILNLDEAHAWITRLLTLLMFRPITQVVFREAVRASLAYQMNIFDAQIWAAAKFAGAAFILTEDMQSAPIIEGIHYVNPFDPAFTFESVGL